MTRFLFYSFAILHTFLLQGTLGRYLDPPPAPTEGKWELWEKCPGESYVNGLSVRWDAEGLGGLRFHCTRAGAMSQPDPEAFYDLNIRSPPPPETEEKWTEPIFCERGIVTGVQLLGNNQPEIPTTDNVALICSDDGLVLDPRENLTGIWYIPNRCNSQEGVCATQAEILTRGSVTWLETLRFDCCQVIHPATTCKSTDNVEPIAECANSEALTPLTCPYQKKKGLSYYNNEINNDEFERSIYEDLGFDLLSALPILSPQLNFDPSQGREGSIVLEDTTEDKVTADPGKTVTVYQVVTTCGYYEIHTDVIETKTEDASPNSAKDDKMEGFHDVEGMQGDSAWDDDFSDEEFNDDEDEEKEKKEAPVAADKGKAVMDGKKNESVEPDLVGDRSEEVKKTGTEKKESDENDDWSDEDNLDIPVQLSKTPEKVDESPVEPEVKWEDADEDWSDEDDKKEVIPTNVPTDVIPEVPSVPEPDAKVEGQLESKSVVDGDKEDEDWGEEDGDELPPAAPEVLPVKSDSSKDKGLIEPEAEVVKDDEDDWEEFPPPAPAAVPAVAAAEADDFTDEDFPKEVEAKGEESNEIETKTDANAPSDLIEPIQQESNTHDAQDAVKSSEIEVFQNVPTKTETKLENLQLGSSEDDSWDELENEAGQGEPTHLEIPIVPSAAAAAAFPMTHEEMSRDDPSDPFDDDFSDEEDPIEDHDLEPKPNTQLDDASGKRAFDFLQTDSEDDESKTVGRKSALVDLSTLESSAREFGEQLSKDVSDFGVEVQKVIDEVKEMPIVQEGQKKIEDTLKTAVETVIGYNPPPKGSEVDGGVGVDADYVVAAVEEETTEDGGAGMKKAGGFVGYIVGGMLVCVVIIVIVIFVIEKKGKGRDSVRKEEYQAEVEPTPEPLLLNHQPIRSSDEKEP